MSINDIIKNKKIVLTGARARAHKICKK